MLHMCHFVFMLEYFAVISPFAVLNRELYQYHLLTYPSLFIQLAM